MENAEQMSRNTASYGVLEGSYVDWSAILGGAVVAVGIGAVFASFGAALGLSTISARPDAGSFDVMVVVSAVWTVVSMVGSYMTGGYVTGRMRRRLEPAAADEVEVRDGMNGLAVWGVGMIISLLVVQGALMATVSAAGSAVGTAAEVAGEVAGGTAQGAAQGVADEAVDAASGAGTASRVDYVTSTMLRPAQVTAGAAPGADLSADAGPILANVLRTGEISPAERAYLASAVSASAGVPPDEAGSRVDAAVTATQELRAETEELAEKAKQTAIDAAETARISAILTAFLIGAASLVSAAAAHAGAVSGGRHRDEGRLFRGLAPRGGLRPR